MNSSTLLLNIILSKYSRSFCIGHMQISINAVAIVTLISVKFEMFLM